MDAEQLRVLLIGNSAGRYSPMSNRLTKRGCECRFAISFQEVSLLLHNHTFDLVLSPTRLKDNSLYSLINLLGESQTTMFYSQAVEDGCWWLPALRWGTDCFGTPAIRPSEFMTVLDETIGEIRCSLGLAPEIQPAAPYRFSGSIVSLPFAR